MGSLLALPVLFILIVLQTTLVSQMTLLSGCADLILLWLAAWGLQKQVRSTWFWTATAAISIAYISAIPWFVPLLVYPFVTLMAKNINRRIWQSPLVMIFVVTIIGSLVENGLAFVALIFKGMSISLHTAMVEVILPSMMINLLLALPIFTIARDLAQWVYPLEDFE